MLGDVKSCTPSSCGRPNADKRPHHRRRRDDLTAPSEWLRGGFEIAPPVGGGEPRDLRVFREHKTHSAVGCSSTKPRSGDPITEFQARGVADVASNLKCPRVLTQHRAQPTITRGRVENRLEELKHPLTSLNTTTSLTARNPRRRILLEQRPEKGAISIIRQDE